MKLLKRLMLAVVALALIGASAAWYVRRNGEEQEKFRTAEIERRDVVATIAATGTVQPEDAIDVGAQVAGRIVAFGSDADGKPIDHASKVTEGMVLAKIDDTVYAAEVTQAKAQLSSAKAGVQRANADVLAFKSKATQALKDWERAQRIGPSDALAQSSYDAYLSAFEIAKANVVVSEAQVEQAKAAQEQAQANLERAERNLSYCTIISPVTGVIIDRRVNIGQTVVASLTAPSLFLIAKDLTQLEVWIAVNEADIAMVKPGQPVTFNVDSLPGESFRGEVRKVRLKASMTQNVVTYTVEVTCDNSGRKLLPYMTANAKFEVNRRDDVLAAPNMALRYIPTQELVAAEFRRGATTGPATQAARGGRPGGGEKSTIWVRQGEFVKPIRVKAGLSDGAFTEVSGEGLSDGMEIVVSEVAESAAATPTSSNPFAPQFGRGGRRGGR